MARNPFMETHNDITPRGALRVEHDLDWRWKREGASDVFAWATCQTTKFLADRFFRTRYGSRAVMLETIAAVPGMVASTFNRLSDIRDTVTNCPHNHSRSDTLYEESKNELMHLKTFIEITQPSFGEKALVFGAQASFFLAFSALYLASKKTAHRLVGFIEEEAVNSYTNYLQQVDDGLVENVAAPEIAKKYWGLPAGARLRDVIIAVRTDEAEHRDVNHRIAAELAR